MKLHNALVIVQVSSRQILALTSWWPSCDIFSQITKFHLGNGPFPASAFGTGIPNHCCRVINDEF